ncbi:hypothetical protein [Streptomyces sp. NPDC101150]|uniref:hypothetical protein n=1 Tax=Streptomyces sp. NPDC101150 TaxID=3366114 RepID=UPI0037F447CA
MVVSAPSTARSRRGADDCPGTGFDQHTALFRQTEDAGGLGVLRVDRNLYGGGPGPRGRGQPPEKLRDLGRSRPLGRVLGQAPCDEAAQLVRRGTEQHPSQAAPPQLGHQPVRTGYRPVRLPNSSIGPLQWVTVSA